GFCLLMPMYFISLVSSSDAGISITKSSLPAYSSTRIKSPIGDFLLSIAGPPIQLPTQADISIKHLFTFPSIMSWMAFLQFSTPSTEIYVQMSWFLFIERRIPPVVGKSLDLPLGD